MKIAVLASGRGSNLEAILAAADADRCDVEVCCVVSDRDDAQALRLAEARGIPAEIVPPKRYADRAAWDAALAASVQRFAPDVVVLAGFMRIVGTAVLGAFPGRIINVHPSLLPAFPGVDAPAQAIAKRVTVSGCTVHIVDAGVDTGPILAQAAVTVLAEDDTASLHARLQRAEHALLPSVLDAIARGDLLLEAPPRYVGRRVDALPSLVWPPVERA